MKSIKQLAIRNSDQNKKKMANESGVVITVYEETGRYKKVMKGNPVSRKSKGIGQGGYDRRAQLLACTQQLRAVDNEEELIRQWNEMSNSGYRSKKRKCPATTPRKLGNSFLGFFRRTKRPCNYYQRLPSDHQHQHQVEDSNISDKHNSRSGKKQKRGRRKLWRKLKGMLKGLSFVWRRKKGQC